MIPLEANTVVACEQNVTDMIPESTTCTFSCKDNFQIVGSSSMLCGKEGSWIFTETPHCVETCPPLNNLTGIEVCT